MKLHVHHGILAKIYSTGVCVCIYEVVHAWRSEDNCVEWVPCFYFLHALEIRSPMLDKAGLPSEPSCWSNHKIPFF